MGVCIDNGYESEFISCNLGVGGDLVCFDYDSCGGIVDIGDYDDDSSNNNYFGIVGIDIYSDEGLCMCRYYKKDIWCGDHFEN